MKDVFIKSADGATSVNVRLRVDALENIPPNVTVEEIHDFNDATDGVANLDYVIISGRTFQRREYSWQDILNFANGNDLAIDIQDSDGSNAYSAIGFQKFAGAIDIKTGTKSTKTLVVAGDVSETVTDSDTVTIYKKDNTVYAAGVGVASSTYADPSTSIVLDALADDIAEDDGYWFVVD